MSQLRQRVARLTDQLTETQLDSLRAVGLILAAGLVAAAGYFGGLPAWRHWQNRKALGQAKVFAEKQDYRSLMLALRRATELAPGDLATWRAATDLLAEIGSQETLFTREQLTHLAPQDMGLRLALAEDAVKFGRFDTAEDAMSGLSAAARQDLAFHRLSAALAFALGRTADLQRELQAILAADPGNLDARFTYASLRLWGPDPGASAAGEADLEKLLADPSVRVRAAVELLSSVSRLGDPRRITSLLVRLLHEFAPHAAPDFSAPAVPAWSALIEGLKAAAANSAADAALVERWLGTIGRWPEALLWVDSLAPAVRNSRAVMDIGAEISATHDDIPRLARLLRDGAWGDWPVSGQVLAIASRIQARQYSVDRGRQTWNDAVGATGDSLVGLRALVRLSSAWNDVDGEEKVLRRVLARDPKVFWAYSALRAVYLRRSDLPQLWLLYDAWSRQLPDDPSIVSAWIMLGSVLNRIDSSALARANELKDRYPDSLPAQVALAAALWRQHRAPEAWALLSALPPAALQRPDISFWEAMVEADLGRGVEASAAIARAQPGATFAEERALLNRAATKVENGH